MRWHARRQKPAAPSLRKAEKDTSSVSLRLTASPQGEAGNHHAPRFSLQCIKEAHLQLFILYKRSPPLFIHVNGRRAITVEMAWLLSRALGTTPEFWISLEMTYQLKTLATDDLPQVLALA